MRSAVLAGAAAAALAPAASGTAHADPSAARSSALGRLLVESSEFRFTLSRRTVRPGRVLVQLRNGGEDPHDLVVRRRGARSGVRFRAVLPGELAERTVRLRRGRYELVCLLPGHLRRGMRAPLRVR